MCFLPVKFVITLCATVYSLLLFFERVFLLLGCDELKSQSGISSTNYFKKKCKKSLSKIN